MSVLFSKHASLLNYGCILLTVFGTFFQKWSKSEKTHNEIGKWILKIKHGV
jgi:hypothetical protein